jgi:hypothetical protein
MKHKHCAFVTLFTLTVFMVECAVEMGIAASRRPKTGGVVIVPDETPEPFRLSTADTPVCKGPQCQLQQQPTPKPPTQTQQRTTSRRIIRIR